VGATVCATLEPPEPPEPLEPLNPLNLLSLLNPLSSPYLLPPDCPV
jgi:hypothetical protein